MDELKLRITPTIQIVTLEMIQKVWNEFDNRLDFVCIFEGHIEQP